MSLINSLLLSPCLSPFDDVENGILSTYILKATQNVYATTRVPNVYNLLLDTPWILYRNHALYADDMSLDPNSIAKYAILTFSLIAIVLYLSSISAFVVVNANGPVMNEGFAAMVGFLAAINKPTLFWKDDVRHLYGAKDNPFVIGFLPSITRRISNTVDRLSGVDTSQPSTCGALSLDDHLRALLAAYTTADVTIAPRLQLLVNMGRDMYTATYAFARVANSPQSPFAVGDVAVYNTLRTILRSYVSGDQFPVYFPEDAKFFQSLG